MKKTIALLLLLSYFIPAQLIRLDSVTVDSVWNSDSGPRVSRDCIVGFKPMGTGQVSLANLQFSLDGGSSWTLPAESLVVLDSGSTRNFACNLKTAVRVRILGGDRSNAAIKVTVKGPGLYQLKKTGPATRLLFAWGVENGKSRVYKACGRGAVAGQYPDITAEAQMNQTVDPLALFDTIKLEGKTLECMVSVGHGLTFAPGSQPYYNNKYKSGWSNGVTIVVVGEYYASTPNGVIGYWFVGNSDSVEAGNPDDYSWVKLRADQEGSSYLPNGTGPLMFICAGSTRAIYSPLTILPKSHGTFAAFMPPAGTIEETWIIRGNDGVPKTTFDAVNSGVGTVTTYGYVGSIGMAYRSYGAQASRIAHVLIFDGRLSFDELLSVKNDVKAALFDTAAGGGLSAPVIAVHPVPRQVYAGQSTVFKAVACGTPDPACQWRRDGADIVGATGATFTLPSAQAADAGSYTVVATNIRGSVTSRAAALVVDPLPASATDTLVQVAGGTFQMGGSAYDTVRTLPVHEVTLSAFRISNTEITQREFQRVMGVNPTGSNGDINRPVTFLTWYDAVLYCNKRSKLEGKDTVYSFTTVTGTPGDGCVNLARFACDLTKNGYRLPTEAEWEYACRAGTTTEFYWGADTVGMNARSWNDYVSGQITHPVAMKIPNAWGLYDMIGNAWEFCNDWYAKGYPAGAATDPSGPGSGSARVIRGGSISHREAGLGSASRHGCNWAYRGVTTGFRVAVR